LMLQVFDAPGFDVVVAPGFDVVVFGYNFV
jgi:hypothetical protein